MIDEPDDEVVDDEDVALDEELDDDVEPTEEDLAQATNAPPEPGLGDVESIQELIAKQETADEETSEDEDEVVLATLARDERLEPLDTRVVPMQETEFTCKRCFLVKHKSQLADRKKMLCRDCA
jgi:hypothetical protein